MSRAFEDRPRGITHCQHCGVEFTCRQRNNRLTYCSQACSMAAKGEQYATTQDCLVCGETFTARRDRNTYCSRECAFEAHKAEPKVKAEPPERTCVVCGRTFRATIGMMCSKECRAEWARRKSREYSAAAKRAKPRSCKECGKVFVPEYGNKRRVFCSEACLRRWNQRRRDRSAEHARRRLREGAGIEPVKRLEIFERDEWLCGICGGPIDRELCFPHPMSKSLDHIVALCNGGDHAPANLQAAHLSCNSFKGALDALEMAS